MRPSRLLPPAVLAGLSVLATASAHAQTAAARAAGLSGGMLLSTVVYGLLGIALCVVGYVLFDKVAGLNLKHELVEDQNLAVGVMLAGAFIGIAIVVAAVMVS